MANVSFYRQTTGSTATGAITFDTISKYIYLGDGRTAHKFNCNNTTYSGSEDYGTYINGSTICQMRPHVAGGSSGHLGSCGEKFVAPLNACLTHWYEDSPDEECLCMTITIESQILNSNWANGNHIIGTAHLVFPPKNTLLKYVDSTNSDRSANVYLFSTPFTAAISTSGVGQCVLKVLYGGSQEYATWRVHRVEAVNATSPTTRVDYPNPAVVMGYEIRAWKTY